MGSVVPLKKEINNSYFELKNMLEDRLNNVNQLIKELNKKSIAVSEMEVSV